MKAAKHGVGKLAMAVLMTLAFLGLLSSPLWAKRLAVDVSVANIRSGPSTEEPVLWQVEQYTPLETLDTDQTGKWYYFKDFEGDKAWIHKTLLKDIDTVITTKGLVNIRSGPGTEHDVLFRAEKGVPFKVLERKEKWLHIQHANGSTGWIYKMLVW
jgi:SH3-like domain-containing protein